MGKPEGRRLCGRPKHRWKDYVNIDLKETEWECVKLIHQARDMDHLWGVAITVMSLFDVCVTVHP